MNPLKVGITGGIGSGKSVVCRIIRTMGYQTFDADNEAKLLYNDDQIKTKVINLLGTSAYLANGEPNRAYIAEKIFNDHELLNSLNQIIHPEVNRKFNHWVAAHAGEEIVFKEAAIMFESGSNRSVDVVIGVLASELTRVQRITKRDGKKETAIRAIMAKQMDQEAMAKLCNYTIINDENTPLMPQILDILNKLKIINKHGR
jgi:dephospho-CoA kinase